MIILLLVLFLGLSQPAQAQDVSVTSGEHDGFSRIVLTYSQPVDWSLYRMDAGYVLTTAQAKPLYDLSGVFRRLSQGRLAQIMLRAEDGALLLRLDCECFAIPFELRPGIVVIDVRDGNAPEGSAFEANAAGERQPPLLGGAPQSVKLSEPAKPIETAILVQPPSTFTAAIDDAARLLQTLPSVPIPAPVAALEQTREELLWQLSKGVASGVVEPAPTLSSKPHRPAEPKTSENIRIGAKAGIDETSGFRAENTLTGQGVKCITDPQLDIASWGGPGDPASEFAKNTTNLVGEFDRPEEGAIARSVRYYLYLGFGAEARQILTSLKVSLPDRAIWETMSYSLDLETPPGTVFSGMEVCDTSAALWSVLAMADLPPPNQIEIPAILRGFSGLPLHLRRHLGPDLASRFLARNDAVSARAIRDAISRAPGEPNAALKLLEAEIELANGDQDAAEAILAPLSGSGGLVGVQSTVALIRARVEEKQDVSSDLTTTAEALLEEAKGGVDEALLRDALALAYASQNRYDTAFGILANPAQNRTPIWQMLAEQGSDDAIMVHAVFQKTAVMPVLPVQTDRTFARRLLDLGFPTPALLWLQISRRTNGILDSEDQLLIAEARLAQNDGLAALAEIADRDDLDAQILRAKALVLLQDPASIPQLSRMGNVTEAARAARQQGVWPDLLQLPEGDVWRDAAVLLTPPAGGEAAAASPVPDAAANDAEPGPLARTRAALEESAAARATLERLLANQAPP